MPSSTDRADGSHDQAWRFRVAEFAQQSFRSQIVQNATWMFSGQGLQLLGRLTYFVIVAHALGPAGYGSFVACVALVGAMTPFASCGTGNVMLKYVARDRGVLPSYFGNALLVTLFGGILLTVLTLLLRTAVLPASATTAMLIAVALGDFLGMEMSVICLQVFQGLQQARRFSQMAAFSTAVRLLAAVVLVFTRPTPGRWAYLYCASSLVATIVGVIAVSWSCAAPRFRSSLVVPSIREGVHFATALASQSIYNDIDKTMLARLSSVEAAAIYAVAYRFIDATTLPIRSVGLASYPEFFRQGAHGVSSGFAFARRILRRSVPYGLAIAVGLLLGAGFVPLILGRAYHASSEALRWLCLLPLFKGVHIFLSDTLTGADYQWQTSSAQIAICIFNVLVNFWIIRAFSWRGAAWSSLMTDGLLVVVLYLIIRWHLRRERPATETPIPEAVFASERD
jgi:O-antigen/teichoic acid export membrane protein